MAELADPQFFIVLGTQRTGTTLLRSILNSNDQVAMVAEVFIPYPDRCHWNEFIKTLPEGSWQPADEAHAATLFARYFEYFHHEVRSNWERRKDTALALGIDVKFDQLEIVEPRNQPVEAIPALLDFARKRRFVLVNTVRKNVVQTMISYLIGLRRNFWHNYDGTTIETPYALEVEECLAYARSIVRQQQTFEAAMTDYPVIRVEYADLASAAANASPSSNLCATLPVLSNIASALGVRPMFQFDGVLQKAIDKPYRDVIENYDELVQALSNSEFAGWIDSIR